MYYSTCVIVIPLLNCGSVSPLQFIPAESSRIVLEHGIIQKRELEGPESHDHKDTIESYNLCPPVIWASGSSSVGGSSYGR